jgi:peptidoglycan hydrolase-like protein with peptidoglycan-binding domain
MSNFFNAVSSGGGGTAIDAAVPAWEVTMMSKLPTFKLNDKDIKEPWYIRRIQGLCLALLPGIKLAIDGKFGASTESAVKQIQQSHGIAVDGVVGPNTWSVLVTGSA